MIYSVSVNKRLFFYYLANYDLDTKFASLKEPGIGLMILFCFIQLFTYSAILLLLELKVSNFDFNTYLKRLFPRVYGQSITEIRPIVIFSIVNF